MKRGLTRKLSNEAARAIQACNVYISEGKSQALISGLKDIADSQKGVALVNVFVDEPYNRTGFTLAAYETSALAEAAVRLAQAALSQLDLRQHAATHPRLGVVDHISCHPLTAAAGLQATAALARSIGTGLSHGAHALPVLFYGEASGSGASLAEVRRALGYFKGSLTGNWIGNLLAALPPGCRQDLGPAEVDPRSGVALIGAVPWVTNYNVALRSCDMAAARGIARSLSERGGGIAGVQAMALPHGQGVEIACNLLVPGEHVMEAVLDNVRRQCQALEIQVGETYRIGRSAAEYAQTVSKQLGSGDQ